MFNRKCPSCKELLIYKNKRKCTIANKNKTSCRSCTKKGEKNPMHGRTGSRKETHHQKSKGSW